MNNVEQLIQSWKNLVIGSKSEVHPSGTVDLDLDETEGVSGGFAPRMSDTGTCVLSGC